MISGLTAARNVNRPDFDFSYLNSRRGFVVDLRKNDEISQGPSTEMCLALLADVRAVEINRYLLS